MPIFNDQKTYDAAMYIRISKDDTEKSESYSVSNQRELIRAFAKTHPEINLCAEHVDDGFSGVNFDRPAIKELLKEIREGNINCVIVKDLSRFGRDYIETGRYIEQVFPLAGVRFIAINDNYDSEDRKASTDGIIIPFKNLINDAYSRDISIKVRSQVEVRQKRGDFIGAFPVFGYKKADGNKHKLVPDEYAAEIVKKIFSWKKSGLNNQKIADRLNEQSVPSPMAYKELMNWAFSTSFKVNMKTKWEAVTVNRILNNEVYTGTMVQGKESRISYKVKKRAKKSKEEWFRVEGTHEAIISKEDFELVGKAMRRDTRTAPDSDALYIFSGMMRCGGCGSNMIRKPVKSNGRVYYYYICRGNKQDKTFCSDAHRIAENQLTTGVFEIVRHHIAAIAQLSELLAYIKELPVMESEVRKIDIMILAKRDKLQAYQKLRLSLYEDFKAGILSKEDYLEMKKEYEDLCKDMEKSLETMEARIDNLPIHDHAQNVWMEKFKEHRNITELTRETVLSLIEKIVIVNRKKIQIYFSYQDEFEMYSRYIENAQTMQENEQTQVV